MANLRDLVKARASLSAELNTYQRILIYGAPKSGKTMLAATVAQMPSIKRIFWFDLENGSATLLNPDLGLTPEQMGKIELYSIPDTKAHPIAIETMLKVFSNLQGITICAKHGKVNCVECKELPDNAPFPAMESLSHTDCIVIDSLSQLGESAFEVGVRRTAGEPNVYAKFAEQGKMLSDVLSMVQQAKTNIICLTHVTVNEAEDTKKDMVVPLCGTRNFSIRIAKYFNTVIYLTVELGRYKAGSSPTYKINVIAGNRLGVKVEALKAINMQSICFGES